MQQLNCSSLKQQKDMMEAIKVKDEILAELKEEMTVKQNSMFL